MAMWEVLEAIKPNTEEKRKGILCKLHEGGSSCVNYLVIVNIAPGSMMCRALETHLNLA